MRKWEWGRERSGGRRRGEAAAGAAEAATEAEIILTPAVGAVAGGEASGAVFTDAGASGAERGTSCYRPTWTSPVVRQLGGGGTGWGGRHGWLTWSAAPGPWQMVQTSTAFPWSGNGRRHPKDDKGRVGRAKNARRAPRTSGERRDGGGTVSRPLSYVPVRDRDFRRARAHKIQQSALVIESNTHSMDGSIGKEQAGMDGGVGYWSSSSLSLDARMTACEKRGFRGPEREESRRQRDSTKRRPSAAAPPERRPRPFLSMLARIR